MSTVAADDALDRSPNPIDIHVGARMRMRRRVLNLTQEKLADSLGVTFQQIQKYERGTNRVSASKLYEAARVLWVPISYFYEGLPEPSPSDAQDQGVERTINEFLMSPSGLELAAVYPRIKNERLKKLLLEMARAFVEVGEHSRSDELVLGG